ncbi:MAG: UvrD-helicase domain-containing protein, partial [Clostridia bacterium]|nr:UvrD-helicase domain-containing protein [Clostridia bacterium]
METKLNDVQKEIVESTEGPIMVLAGAGSGKTRVLTHRIAHIIRSGRARPYEVLAITFTNKAANEIKNRLLNMGVDSSSVWAMTFHSMCCKILRLEASQLDGYTSNFSIFDEQDKKSVIKKILKEMNIKEDNLTTEIGDKISNF